MFFEAQIMTQELKRGNDNLDKQGHVYLYPESTLGRKDLSPYETLTYIKYQSDNENEDTFKKRVERNDPNIQNYFSINPQGQLILASLVTTTVEVSSTTEGHLFGNNSSQTTYEATELPPIDYKSMISQYATPMNFFLELGMVTRNPEFLADVVKLVKSRTNIQLTVLNETTTEINTQVDKETEHIKGNKEELITDENGEVIDRQVIPYDSSTLTTTTTTTTIITVIPSVKVTSVDTWIGSQDVIYSKIPGIPVEDDYTIPQESEEEPPLGSDEIGEVSWITREESTVHTSTKKDTYDAGIATDFIDNTDDFIKLLNKEYKVPNSKEKRKAGNFLRTDAELFFLLLSQDPETAGMETVMRFIMNKYMNSNIYGDVTLEDIENMYKNELMDITGEDIIVNTAMSEKDIVITDVNKLKEAINATYSGQARTNLEQNAGTFIQMQNTYNVNAVFAIAVTIVESSGGTNWSAIAPETHNWMSVTGSYNGQTYRDPNSSNERTWRVYPSYREAILDFGDLIANSSYYFKAGRNTVKTIAPTYCSAEWGNSVVAEMLKIYNSVGISTGGSSAAQGNGYSTTYTSSKTGRTYKEFKQNRGSYSTMIHGYSGRTIAEAGCNITSMAIVISGYGYDVNPGTFGGKGNIIATATDTKKYLKGTTGMLYGNAKSTIMDHLNAGGEVIIHVNSTSSYTFSEHWMPLLDIKGEQVYVSNPYDHGNGSLTGWDNIDNVLRGISGYFLVSR